MPLSLAFGVAVLAGLASAQQPNSFELVGDVGVSAQFMFLGSSNKLFILDRSEQNPLQIDGHSAWAAEWDISERKTRAMKLSTNTFCAGGSSLGDGRWLNVAGNGPEGVGGEGRKAIRLLTPNNDGTVEWTEGEQYLSSFRWYPTVETLATGDAIIIGGSTAGAYVNSETINNPTYEFLNDTLPANQYPLTWLLPSGKLFIQAGFKSMTFDPIKNIEIRMDDVPIVVRAYPASAATTMLPLTPANEYTATVLMCGGSSHNWHQDHVVIPDLPTDNSCVKITPDKVGIWEFDDPLNKGRTMGQFINLPDGRLLMIMGAHMGTAGYGGANAGAIGNSYAKDPANQNWYFDPSAPAGSRWSPGGTSNIARMYHSAAVLMPDGAIAVTGSNPNAGFRPMNPGWVYHTETRIEYFYPDYYYKKRPQPAGFPQSITYGGQYFNMTLPADDFGGKGVGDAVIKAMIVRPGLSTHGLAMGQRSLELAHSYTQAQDGSVTLHISQAPPNPSLLAPGPALLFIVINGTPSKGEFVMIGDGKIGTHNIADASVLPKSEVLSGTPPNTQTGPTQPPAEPSPPLEPPTGNVSPPVQPPAGNSSPPAPPATPATPAVPATPAPPAPPAPPAGNGGEESGYGSDGGFMGYPPGSRPVAGNPEDNTNGGEGNGSGGVGNVRANAAGGGGDNSGDHVDGDNVRQNADANKPRPDGGRNVRLGSSLGGSGGAERRKCADGARPHRKRRVLAEKL